MMNGSRYSRTPVSDFFKKFLPTRGPRFNKSKYDTTIDLTPFNVGSKSRKDERACYPILCDFINRAFGEDGDLVCKDVSDWPDKSLIAESKAQQEQPVSTSGYSSERNKAAFSPDTRRVDLATYRLRDEFGKECSTPWVDATLNAGARSQHAARNSFAHAMEALEIKLDGDAWTFDSDGLLPSTERAREIRGQVCDYVAEVMQRQHREFLLTVSIYRTKAYLMHWDRVGTVISEPIDLATEPEQLFKFFFQLRKATDAEHGLDSTATAIVDDADNHPSVVAMKEALAALPDEARVKPYITKAFGGDLWPYYELEVPDRVSPSTSHTFLVRNLSTRTTSPSPTGRGTKGYIAFDLEKKKFCFLKDAWRADADGVHPEIDVYKRFEGLATPIAGIATVSCGGDMHNAVGSKRRVRQETKTQAWLPGYAPRIHTRIVLNEVGIPLRDYQHSFELCSIVFDAFSAHDAAWRKGKVLHRDVSDGNIVIYVDYEHPHKRPRGLLIDWDLCKFEEELSRDSTQKSRSGTWRFLSAALLRFPLKPNEVADDIESFYHLLMLYALRFHHHDVPIQELKGILEFTYDFSEYHVGYWIGSTSKYRQMATADLPCQPAGQFGSLLVSLAALIKKHYQGLDKELAMYAVPQAITTTPKAVSSDPFDVPPSTMDATDDSEDPPPDYVITPADSVISTVPEPSERPLKTHEQFSIAMWRAVYQEKQKWNLGDKLPYDQFRSIKWGPSPSKRTATADQQDPTDENAPKKRKTASRAHEPQNPSRLRNSCTALAGPSTVAPPNGVYQTRAFTKSNGGGSRTGRS
ncbi:hypothetical protein BXZ70DRAFT_1065138 [Cristinia sonorae]|uniref:Fungal-type protein kinase domain-containing protein n=1 Tax=Cristinia sonorae TaxID=1940300 RepID=A0A8K0UNS1_9AGAR|nr:hypothetical protein BXZ70DRAFT_1065138 [Cristinia sonorae]